MPRVPEEAVSVRVLLTGATGFIGSHVAREMVRRGHEVHATLRPGSDRRRLRDLEGKITVWEGDLEALPVEPDVLLHLAWYAVPGKYLEAPENRDCLEATRRLLGKLSCRAICAGSCFEQDTRLGTLAEGSPTRPTSFYARSKDTLRQEVEQRPNSVWLRFFYQYGPWEDTRRLIPAIMRGIIQGEPVKLTPGGQARDFLHVWDVARAAATAAEGTVTGTLNIGSGKAFTQKEIAGKIAHMGGRPDLLRFGAVPYFEGEPMLIVADNRKLLSTGWAPTFDLDRGLRHTFDWWKHELNGSV